MDITCKKLGLQCHCGNKNTFKTAAISADGILQKEQYFNGLKYDMTIVPVILHEFHNSKGH